MSVCGCFGQWPSWSVAISVCGLSDLWPLRCVVVPVCGRFGLWPFGLCPFLFVALCQARHKESGSSSTQSIALQWRHNECDSVSNHQPSDCLPNRVFWRRSKKTSKLRVSGLCAGNSPVTGEFPTQMGSNAENVLISWRHHGGSSPVIGTDTAVWHDTAMQMLG